MITYNGNFVPHTYVCKHVYAIVLHYMCMCVCGCMRRQTIYDNDTYTVYKYVTLHIERYVPLSDSVGCNSLLATAKVPLH